MRPALTLLDAVRLHRRDGSVTEVVVATTKALDLLRLVAGAGEQVLAADHYVSLLWPEVDEARGRSSLRTALSHLRKALGPDVVRRSGDTIVLGEVDTDVDGLRRGADEVETLVAAGDDVRLLQRVQELDQGFGTEVAVSAGSCEAVHDLREELREVRSRVMLDGAAAAHRLGRSRTSLDLALRADAIAPGEACARALMTAWAALGETRRAIEVFTRLEEGLAATFGVPPSPETRAVYLQVVTAGANARTRRVRHHAAVVGTLSDDIVALMAPSVGGGVVWMHGEPGAGRGSVAREAVLRVQAVSPRAGGSVLVLPEVIGFDEVERARLLSEATAHRTVLLVPVRRRLDSALGPRERAVTVGPLSRREFRRLLAHLLQELPTPALEERLWRTTGGLAGHVVRTVGSLLAHDALYWAPGQVDLGTA